MDAQKDTTTPDLTEQRNIITQTGSTRRHDRDEDEDDDEEDYELESFVHVENLSNQGANASEINKLCKLRCVHVSVAVA